MKKHFPAFLLMVLISFQVAGQDDILVNPYANPLWINPAYTGGSDGKTLYTSYRKQWPGLSDNTQFNNLFVAADLPIDRLNGGVGILFLDDRRSHMIVNNKYYVTYGQSFNISDDLSFRLGAKAGLIHGKISFEALDLGDPIGPRGFVYPTDTVIRQDESLKTDFGTGIALSSEKFDLGVSLEHLNRPKTGFFDDQTGLPMRLSVHGSYTFGSEEFSVTPHVVYHLQSGYHFLVAGSYLNYKKLLFGLSVIPTSHRFRPGALIGFKTEWFRVAYSYDVMLATSWGSHELMLSLTLPEKKERTKLRPVHKAF